jgi:hypothetical protein
LWLSPAQPCQSTRPPEPSITASAAA